jgi:hypothetical protein
LIDLFRSLHDERFYSDVLFLSSVGEVAWPVLEQHYKAKGQNHEQSQPKNRSQKSHFKKQGLAGLADWLPQS